MSKVSTERSEDAEAATDCFIIDGRSSRFMVRAFATGMLSAMGHNPNIGIRDLSGEFSFDPEQLNASGFRLVIKSSSLGVVDDISDRDRREMERLMNQEVLETTKFPEIIYEANDIPATKMGDSLYSATLNGKLTLRSVTQSEPIVARIALQGCMLRASGDFSLSQSTYGIRPVSVAGGVLKLKDELKLQFEIVARKRE
jgi:polyisoprenoid-binding protein YceI